MFVEANITNHNEAADEAGRVSAAARQYIARQAREEHPEGHFDTGGRWFPDQDERCFYCDLIRQPSRSWPYSLLIHARTMAHIAARDDLDRAALRREVNRLKRLAVDVKVSS